MVGVGENQTGNAVLVYVDKREMRTGKTVLVYMDKEGNGVTKNGICICGYTRELALSYLSDPTIYYRR